MAVLLQSPWFWMRTGLFRSWSLTPTCCLDASETLAISCQSVQPHCILSQLQVCVHILLLPVIFSAGNNPPALLVYFSLHVFFQGPSLPSKAESIMPSPWHSPHHTLAICPTTTDWILSLIEKTSRCSHLHFAKKKKQQNKTGNSHDLSFLLNLEVFFSSWNTSTQKIQDFSFPSGCELPGVVGSPWPRCL